MANHRDRVDPRALLRFGQERLRQVVQWIARNRTGPAGLLAPADWVRILVFVNHGHPDFGLWDPGPRARRWFILVVRLALAVAAARLYAGAPYADPARVAFARALVAAVINALNRGETAVQAGDEAGLWEAAQDLLRALYKLERVASHHVEGREAPRPEGPAPTTLLEVVDAVGEMAGITNPSAKRQALEDFLDRARAVVAEDRVPTGAEYLALRAYVDNHLNALAS